jgi:hypothetical protein
LIAASPFCGKCGTYRPVIAPGKRACPRCHPEKVEARRSSLDKTGMPCKDRGSCQPERCVKGLECEEGRK